jgi:hypothetical protein
MIEGKLQDMKGKLFGVSLILVYASLVPAERKVLYDIILKLQLLYPLMVLGDFNQILDFKHRKNYILSPSVDKRVRDVIKDIIE